MWLEKVFKNSYIIQVGILSTEVNNYGETIPALCVPSLLWLHMKKRAKVIKTFGGLFVNFNNVYANNQAYFWFINTYVNFLLPYFFILPVVCISRITRNTNVDNIIS